MAPVALADLSLSVITPNGRTTPLNSNPASLSAAATTGYRGYDHVHWYVGNAKQAAAFYVSRFGFREIAYRGLETGSRDVASHVVENGRVRFVLSSPIRGLASDSVVDESEKKLREVHSHLSKHGDAVKDVSFEVDDVLAVYSYALASGAKAVSPPTRVSDRDGSVVMATLQTYGETTHTLIQRSSYHGAFLPGYRTATTVDPLCKLLPRVNLEMVSTGFGL